MHKALYQLIVTASGALMLFLMTVCLKKLSINRPYYGLLLIPGIWRELVNFSSGAVCLVLSSEKYNPDDYIRDYSVFKNSGTII